MRYCPQCGVLETIMGVVTNGEGGDQEHFCVECGWKGKYSEMIGEFRALIRRVCYREGMSKLRK